MPFTDTQARAVKAALDRHLSECPVCRSKTWSLSGSINLLPLIAKDNAVELGRGQPVVTVICRTCGNILSFNLFFLPGLSEMLGIKPDVRDEKKDG